ncbi:MAG TPA: GDSL-type esterase/lipase family protein, partial [Polyangiaceae bacterium]|nr:GDSL-type esterase/lipase family protein [Polyangiaceae bacterium]
GQVRKMFADRFGAAGPGFVHLGYKNYRHDGLKLDIHGKWRMRPKKPVGVKRDGDGVFGLGGLMMSGYADGPRVSLSLTEPFAADSLVFDVCYRLHEPNDAVVLRGGGLERTELRATRAEPAGVVRHAAFTARANEPFVVDPVGRTDLCGVIAETDPAVAPGVVLDTLAINGARYATALAWDEDAWVAEATRRTPDLVVLELGTNEAGDLHPAFDATARRMTELLARARRANPDVDCVVVSNTDRADAETSTTRMHDVLRDAASKSQCLYFDAWQHLGGEGAMARMREEAEPKVQKDGIHLTIKGYRELGTTMFEELMRGYAGRSLPAASAAAAAAAVDADQRGGDGSTETPMARATPSR